MRSQLIGLLAGLSVVSMATFAEPPVQAGETLESLSKVKVSTTVNGQPGSLNELISSGQIKPVQQTEVMSGAEAAPAMNPNAAAEATATEAPQQEAPAVDDSAVQPGSMMTEAPQADPAANQ
ncbi:hypothetical protein [Acinetobacter sp. KS-LM10]|uniref:hypothetical protein n=1 Tax=Acinetobacter sp. KS-LM10 TaxID=3120518 RepID=UPI0030CBF529